MGLSEAATEKLLIIADKISNQKYMSAIKNAFSTLMPVIITGAFVHLLQMLFVLQQQMEFLWLKYQDLLG